MTIVREQIDETGTLRIHSKGGCEVVWQFFEEDGVTPDPTPPTTLRLEVETGLSKLLTPGAQAHIFTMTITEAEGQAMRTAAIPIGQTRPRSVKWAVIDETPAIHDPLWEGIVEFEGW